MLPYHSVCAPSFPLCLSPSLLLSLSLFFYVFLLVNRCWFVYLIDSRHTHTHTSIKESFVNLDLCSLPSSLPLSSLCVWPKRTKLLFQIKSIYPGQREKVFFIWLAALPGLPFINRPELRIKLCTWRVCLLLLCIRYVTLRIRNVLHGLHGVIDKVKFRTFAANFCGRLLWF